MNKQYEIILGILNDNKIREQEIENRFIQLLVAKTKVNSVYDLRSFFGEHRSDLVNLLHQEDIIISSPYDEPIFDIGEFKVSTTEVIDLLNRVADKYLDFEWFKSSEIK